MVNTKNSRQPADHSNAVNAETAVEATAAQAVFEGKRKGPNREWTLLGEKHEGKHR